jgi:antitoxin MazE
VRGRIKKWGNSAAVRILPSVMHAASLESGEVVDVREEAGRIVIEPVRRKKYDLDNLAKRITSKNQYAAVDFGPVRRAKRCDHGGTSEKPGLARPKGKAEGCGVPG